MASATNNNQKDSLLSVDKDGVAVLNDTHWFACRTEPRAEKLADKGLERLRFEHYLPVIHRLQTWSDRKKWVSLPLFPGYIFVRVNLSQAYMKRRLLEAPKIVNLVQKESIPLPVPDKVLQSVRILAMEWNDEFELRSKNLEDYFRVGESVRIVSGPLKGVIGVIQKRTNYPRVMVYIEAIGQGIVFDVDMNNLEKED